MKTLFKGLLIIVALVGIQSVSYASEKLAAFKRAVLNYEQVLLKGKKLNPREHYDLLDDLRNGWDAIRSDRRKTEAENFAKSKGLDAEKLAKRLESLSKLLDDEAGKIDADAKSDVDAAAAARPLTAAELAAHSATLGGSAASVTAAGSVGSTLAGSAAEESEAASESAGVAPYTAGADIKGEAEEVIVSAATAKAVIEVNMGKTARQAPSPLTSEQMEDMFPAAKKLTKVGSGMEITYDDGSIAKYRRTRSAWALSGTTPATKK